MRGKNIEELEKEEAKAKSVDFEVVDVFKHRSRFCVVVKMNRLSGYHNGYVSAQPRHKGEDYSKYVGRIQTDELTYAGDLSLHENNEIPKDKWFFGFDSAHYWNETNPESKTFESVKGRTKKLADEMIDKGV